MARRGVCPPGVICFSSPIGIVLGLTFLLIIGWFVLVGKSSVISQTYTREQTPIQIIQPPPVVSGVGLFGGGGDDRYTRAPEPLRFWQTGPDLRGAMMPPGAVPINISTRGMPQQFQQAGLIKTGDQLLPLYGRQTGYRTDRFNYYTRTDTYNPIQVPIRYQKRDCMDQIGCEELLGGETVDVGGVNKSGTVEVYKFDGPTYIPGIV